ncbi:MAG: hypothetical protein P4M00_21025 [Azospirillaceae bacterium]|nr:hypothetical protein [Azospirillaceae bacterium]
MSKILMMMAAILLLAGSAAVVAQASPFDGDKPATRYQPAPSAAQGSDPFAFVSRMIVSVQRQASLALTGAMVAMRHGPSMVPVLWGVLVAFLYGCFHAAGPGHGKTVVISYFLSQEARLTRGLMLGLRISLAHVVSAIVIVLVLKLLMDHTLPASLEDMRDVKLVSYVIVFAIGAYLFREAWQRRRTGSAPGCAACRHHGHEPAQGDLSSGHPGHHHDHGFEAGDATASGAWGRWRDRIIGALLGCVPCTGAILILLFAMANGLWLAGLMMVVAIGVGMTVTMGLLGVGAVLARRQLAAWARSGDRRSRLVLGLDFAGPAFVMLFGVALFATALTAS